MESPKIIAGLDRVFANVKFDSKYGNVRGDGNTFMLDWFSDKQGLFNLFN